MEQYVVWLLGCCSVLSVVVDVSERVASGLMSGRLFGHEIDGNSL